MTVPVRAGRASVSVTSGAEVDLLSDDADGVGMATVKQWALSVSTNNDITLRVYKAVGGNVGLVLVSGLTTTATSAVPKLIEWWAEACQRIRVTGQATGATATVNCDFFVTGSR